MTPTLHKVYIGSLLIVLILALAYLALDGYSYYNTGLEERFYHSDHETLKPSGMVGHGLGVFGSLSMIIGVSVYMLRKRVKSLARLGKIKHWLEFHIFLCLLGPLLVLFHTSFKIGGVVAISFWSMMAVVLSGIIGRFIYIQIPRTIEGREMSLNEIGESKKDIRNTLENIGVLDKESLDTVVSIINKSQKNQLALKSVKRILKTQRLPKSQRKRIMRPVKNEISLNHRIGRLQAMQNLFKYWHVAHLPFALIMLIIMIVHVAVSFVFGYTWKF